VTLVKGPAHDLPAEGSGATDDQELHADRFTSGLSLGVRPPGAWASMGLNP
jgi:hypothetical protein